MSKIKLILSNIFYAIYRAACIQLTHFSYDDCENTCDLIIILKSDVWSICHCLGVGHEKMVCALCLSIFLFLRYKQYSFSVVTIAYENGNVHNFIFFAKIVRGRLPKLHVMQWYIAIKPTCGPHYAVLMWMNYTPTWILAWTPSECRGRCGREMILIKKSHV